MHWIPLLIIFFIQVAHVLGVLATLLLVIAMSFISFICVSLVRAQGLRILGQMQIKLIRGESLAGEMIKASCCYLRDFCCCPGFSLIFSALYCY